MTYGVLNGLDYIFAAARARGLKVTAIIWLDADQTANSVSITAGIENAKQFEGTITALSCGSEVRTRTGRAVADQVIGDCITRLRAAGVSQPITSIDTWWQWCNESWPCQPWDLAFSLDWLGVNVFPWWENRFSGLFPCTTAAEAADFHIARLQNIVARYPGKQVALTEFGWPAGPNGYSETNRFTGQRCGIASEENQRLVLESTIAKLNQHGFLGHAFSAFAEPWKDRNEGPIGTFWAFLGVPPSISSIPDQIVLEDASTGPLAFTVDDLDTGTTTLTISALTSNETLVPETNVVWSGSGPNRAVTITPAANQTGTTTLTLTVTDGRLFATTEFLLSVAAVNDPPTFITGADQTVSANAGPQSVVGWATGLSAGPGDESGQVLNFHVTANTRPELFSAGPSISPSGTLTYTPAPNATGRADVTLVLKDNGGTGNGGTDVSVPATFAITLESVPSRIIELTGNFGFGARRVGTSTVRTLTIANRGDSLLTVTALSYPEGFSGDWSSGTIPSGLSQVVNVTFRPTAVVTYGGSVTVTSNHTSGIPTIPISGRGFRVAVHADFEGDGTTSVAVYRPSTGMWYVRNSPGVQWGDLGDVAVPGDYNGDRAADVGVFRPSTGVWYIRGQFSIRLGAPDDIPVPGDYNGDGTTDVAIYRPSTGLWLIRNQSSFQWGDPGDIPVPADYNGDGVTDIAIYRPSSGTWYVRDQFRVQFGDSGDLPVPGDYNGDGLFDVAVYRPTTGLWYIRGQFSIQHGDPGDITVPGDFNGDGATDVAVYRPSTGAWYVRNQFAARYGDANDIPLARVLGR